MPSFPPLYILRHGQTHWNAEHRIQGRLDSPLTQKGLRHACDQNTILKRRDLNGFRFFCSPQGRAFHTASLALAELASRIETDNRLAEINVGDWEGMRRAELIPDQEMDESEEKALHLYDNAPGGEGFSGLFGRCQSFLAELETPSVLVTHGITSRMLRVIILGQKIAQIGDLPGGQGVVYHLEGGIQQQLRIGA